MKTSDSGIALIKRFEGVKLKTYSDAVGKLTIGYGHTANVKAGQVITQDQAEIYLKSDLAKFESNVNKYNNKYIWNQNEFDALVSFAFNTGSINSLTANGIRTKGIIAAKFLDYNQGRINGELKEIPGLTTRRKAERELFLKGIVDHETLLPSTAGLSNSDIKANIIIVQKWLNEEYGEQLKKCKSTGYKLLNEDGLKGNKTRAALTIVLQIHLNSLGANLKVDGYYESATNSAVRKYIAVKKGTNDTTAKIVQAILYLYGYNPQAFREEFTAESVTTLKLCQRDNNLTDDGIAGVIFFTTLLKQR